MVVVMVMVVVMMSIWIFENMPAVTYPKNSCDFQALPDLPRPCDHAKAHPHSSPRDPRQKNGHRSQTRRATTFQSCPPEMESNHYISFWLSGRALDSGQAERQFKSHCLCVFVFSNFIFPAPLTYHGNSLSTGVPLVLTI